MSLAINMTGTIRRVGGDAPALSRLFVAVDDEARTVRGSDLVAILERGHLIVLDVGTDVLGAAAYVVLHGAQDGEVHARIQYLVVHPALVGTGAEERLITAVLGVCEDSGCLDLDLEVDLGDAMRLAPGRS